MSASGQPTNPEQTSPALAAPAVTRVDLSRLFRELRPPRYDWYAAAACSGTDDNGFLQGVKKGPRGVNPTLEDKMPAVTKRYCAGCAVRLECLVTGVVNHEEAVWGGTEKIGRERLQRLSRSRKPSIEFAEEVATPFATAKSLGDVAQDAKAVVYDALVRVAYGYDAHAQPQTVPQAAGTATAPEAAA